jgi:S-adenosylmethionine:diacylglycerol 3-amino-3-carboxypropyl transferase
MEIHERADGERVVVPPVILAQGGDAVTAYVAADPDERAALVAAAQAAEDARLDAVRALPPEERHAALVTFLPPEG